MKRGKLSNVPAPSVYIDGALLFDVSFFGLSARRQYVPKLVKLMRYVNIIIVLVDTAVSKKQVENSPFIFTEIVALTKEEVLKKLRKEKTVIFTIEDRVELFSTKARPFEASIEVILAEVGVK